jgi:Kdo2-lipid IVA lauroyltransferase/acyltransferase
VALKRTRWQRIARDAARGAERANHWLLGQAARLALSVLRLLPPDRALDFADRVARRFGPLFGRHRVATSNLAKAYPEKSEAEVEEIAREMWGNMARLAAEYVFLDSLFDFDAANPTAGRVEVRGIDRFVKVASDDRPHIVFTAHLGCFEMLPVAAATYGLEMTTLFRPPNNPYIAKYVFSTRRLTMGDLMASRAGAAFALSRILDDGGNIGMLVDQRFNGGEATTFFGRDCQTSPLLPKLARHYECDVYPARSIRLPGNRYRLEIEERLDLPRAGDGRVDVQATAQMLNDVVERWVREHPGQWMWFHKRWGHGRRPRRWGLGRGRSRTNA